MAKPRSTLTQKQQAFADAFDGNATDAARKAGYSGNDVTLAVTGSRLLKNAQVRRAIEARQAPTKKQLIATRAERQEFWSGVMVDPSQKMADRLRAAELLGKSQADFIERHQHDVGEGLASLLAKARKAGP